MYQPLTIIRAKEVQGNYKHLQQQCRNDFKIGKIPAKINFIGSCIGDLLHVLYIYVWNSKAFNLARVTKLCNK